MIIKSRYITNSSIPEADYVPATINFNGVCIANKSALLLDTTALAEIAKATNDLNTQFTAWIAAQAASANAKGSKDAQFKASRAVINKWAKTFRANTAVPDALLDQLMLAPHKPGRTVSAPTTPTNFKGTTNGEGMVSLQWSRNGNSASTQFIIEYRLSPTAPWAIAGASSSVRFDYQGTAGSYVAFRVYAKKKTANSAATAALIFWEDSSSQTVLKVA